MDRISVNLEHLNTIIKKLQVLQEEAYLLVNDADKNIINAELEGWNDKRFYEFKDSFDDTKGTILNAIKKIDEEHIPFLRKIHSIADEY